MKRKILFSIAVFIFISNVIGYTKSIGTMPNITDKGTLGGDFTLCCPILTDLTFNPSAGWDIRLKYGFGGGDILISPTGCGILRYGILLGTIGQLIPALYIDTEKFGIQLHLNLDFVPAFSIESSYSIDSTFEGPLSKLNAKIIIAPVINIGERFAIFLEISPYWWVTNTSRFTETGRFDLSLIPGVNIALGEGDITLGVGIDGFLYTRDPINLTFHLNIGWQIGPLIKSEEEEEPGISG